MVAKCNWTTNNVWLFYQNWDSLIQNSPKSINENVDSKSSAHDTFLESGSHSRKIGKPNHFKGFENKYTKRPK